MDGRQSSTDVGFLRKRTRDRYRRVVSQENNSLTVKNGSNSKIRIAYG